MPFAAARQAIEWYCQAHSHSFTGISRESLTEMVQAQITQVRQDLLARHAEAEWIEYAAFLLQLMRSGRLVRDDYEQLAFWLQTNGPALVRRGPPKTALLYGSPSREERAGAGGGYLEDEADAEAEDEWFALMRMVEPPEGRSAWVYRPLSTLGLESAACLTRVHKDHLRDLLAEVKRRHNADGSDGMEYDDDDDDDDEDNNENDDEDKSATIDQFVKLIYSDGWTPAAPVLPTAPSTDIYRLPSPTHASVQAGTFAMDQPLPSSRGVSLTPMPGGGGVGRKRAHDADELLAPPGRRKHDPVYLRAFPTRPEQPCSAIQFQWHDGQGMFVAKGSTTTEEGSGGIVMSGSGGVVALSPGWTPRRAYLEAMRKWDGFQWGRVTAYNLAVAVHLARRRVRHWHEGRAVHCRPAGEPQEIAELFRDLNLCQQRRYISDPAAADAYRDHCFDVPPPIMASWLAAGSGVVTYTQPTFAPAN